MTHILLSNTMHHCAVARPLHWHCKHRRHFCDVAGCVVPVWFQNCGFRSHGDRIPLRIASDHHGDRDLRTRRSLRRHGNSRCRNPMALHCCSGMCTCKKRAQKERSPHQRGLLNDRVMRIYAADSADLRRCRRS